jgi:hypothetical protein
VLFGCFICVVRFHLCCSVVLFVLFGCFICVVRLFYLCCSVVFCCLFVLFGCYLSCSVYCLCVNVYCHRVTIQLQLINISYHIIYRIRHTGFVFEDSVVWIIISSQSLPDIYNYVPQEKYVYRI